MTRPTPWTPEENRALVALYFTMLDKAIRAQPYSKAAMIRTAQSSGENVGIQNGYHGQLPNRSKQSVEFKLMNATAAHICILTAAGKSTEGPHQTMDGFGYRAMPNYQAALKDAMAAELETREGIARVNAWGTQHRANLA